MKKDDSNRVIVSRIHNKIGQKNLELEALKDDNTITGLRKRADLMLEITGLMELIVN